MGAYISKSWCEDKYNITINCGYDFDAPKQEDNFVGDHRYGELPADGDVAGIGVIAMYIAVTGFALTMSGINVIYRFHMACCSSRRKDKRRQSIRQDSEEFNILSVLEVLVLSCSDQQIFTGGAYALALRFWKGCSITAYHYSIVTNMLVLSCATHLMSIAVVRNYWRYPYLALLRTIVIAGLFACTGVLLSNMNTVEHGPLVFPSQIPSPKERNGLQLVLAACFQGGTRQMAKTMKQSFDDKTSAQAFRYSAPENRIEGWNFYIITLLWYMVALVVEGVRFVRRKDRWREKVLGWLKPVKPGDKWSRRLVLWADWFYGIYVFGCVVTGGIMVGWEANYMLSLRGWVARSGWLEKNEQSKTEEDDWSSFGQLVPMFLGLLTLFTLVQAISEMYASRRDKEARSKQGGSQVHPSSDYNRLSQTPMGEVTPHAMTTNDARPFDRQSQASIASQTNTQQGQTQPLMRPHLSSQDTRDSSAPLMASPPLESPYTPLSVDIFTPAFPISTYGPETAPSSTYFPTYGQEQTSPVGSIPRRPVGSTSPVQARQHSLT